MKIGFDAKRLFSNFTGLGNYSRFVLKILLKYYPEHTYLLYSPHGKKNTGIHATTSHQQVHVKHPPSWMVSLHLQSYWRSVALGQTIARDGLDVFHGLSNELPLSSSPGTKTVVTIHDVIFKRYPQFYNPIDVKIYSLKTSLACRKADKIVAISQQTADDLHTYYKVRPDKIRVIYQGCNNIFKQKSSAEQLQAVKKKYSLPDIFLLTVGTIEARKNTLSILRALNRIHSSVPLVIVGKPTKYLHQLNQYIEKNALQQGVHFLHHVDLPDLPHIYQMATIFLYPSLFEGFGIPIIEAIASGVPVITSQGSCFAEAGGPYSRYVDPLDDLQFADAITDIMSDKSKQHTMSSQSLQYITRFDDQQVASELMSLYRELL